MAEEEQIGGEHIFVTDNDWKRLCEQFDISGIPFGILIGKDGKIIKTGVRTINTDDPLLRKALEE